MSLFKVETVTTFRTEIKQEVTIVGNKVTNKLSVDGSANETKIETPVKVGPGIGTVTVGYSENSATGEKKAQAEFGVGMDQVKANVGLEVVNKNGRTTANVGGSVEVKKGNTKSTTSIGVSF